MTQECYIFFGERGYWAKAGGYTTVLKDAKIMPFTEGVAFCKKRYSTHDGAIAAVPVAVEVIQEIGAK